MEDKDKKSACVTGEEDIQEDEGKDLCSKCGNLMVDEGGEKTCSSCADDIDFFGEDEDIEKLISKE